MTDSEKWAWWTLGLVTLSVATWLPFVMLKGGGPASQVALALMALTAVPASSRRKLKGRDFDEREKEISGKALLAGFRALWVAFIAGVLIIGFVEGWDVTLSLPMWKLTTSLWLAAMLVLTVEAATTLVLYRQGSHA